MYNNIRSFLVRFRWRGKCGINLHFILNFKKGWWLGLYGILSDGFFLLRIFYEAFSWNLTYILCPDKTWMKFHFFMYQDLWRLFFLGFLFVSLVKTHFHLWLWRPNDAVMRIRTEIWKIKVLCWKAYEFQWFAAWRQNCSVKIFSQKLSQDRKKEWQTWNLNPCPFGPGPESGALDHSANINVNGTSIRFSSETPASGSNFN